MGNAESSDSHKFDGCETLGYRILGVQPNSPASRAGLVSFFDFLVGANGQLLFGIDDGSGSEYFEDVDFPALLKGSVDQEIELLVWNIKSKTQRFLTLTPTPSWGGKGLIGVTIRMDDYAVAEENLLRVLAVEKQSPAAIAGLTPNTDYLLGTTVESFESEDVLAEVLEANVENVVEIYVYNTESDVVRVVTLVPSLNWGGNGLLGAEIGRGYLHRLPKDCRNTLGVSFERKVLVNNDNETSCGAVDLKLNELAIKDEGNQATIESNGDSVHNDSPPEELVKEAEQKIETDEEIPPSAEGDDTEDNDAAENEETVTKNDADDNVEETPVTEDEDSHDIPPPSTVSKFPSIPQLQLQDFSLTNEKVSPALETSSEDLLPPPISSALGESASEMTSVDLQ